MALKSILVKFFCLSFFLNNPIFGQDTIKEKQNFLSYLIPSQLDYVGSTDFKTYNNGISLTKLIFGTTIKKEGFTGDGFNTLFDLGFTYTYLNKSNYISLFPQFSGITWWGAHFYLRSEPIYNLNKHTFDYLSAEISSGLFAHLSLFCWFPLNNSNNLYLGFKFGYYLPLHLKFVERQSNVKNKIHFKH